MAITPKPLKLSLSFLLLVKTVLCQEVTLNVSSTSVSEAQKFVEVCVQLSSPLSMMDRNISLVTMDMTAVASVPENNAVGDYEPLNVMMVFLIGSTELRMCVNITVNVDGNLEGPETFLVDAISENGDNILNSPQPISIISEDTVTVGFAKKNYTFAESTSLSEQTVCVTIQEGKIQSNLGPVQTQLNLLVISMDGTANSTAPADFTFPAMNIVLSAENTIMCFSAGIVDDIIDEDTEEFTLSIFNDPEAIFNIMQGETTIIITDNDCVNGSLRLIDGPTNREGRVEVCQSGHWGAVCGEGWGDREAGLVCRELGFLVENATLLQLGERCDPSFRCEPQPEVLELTECSTVRGHIRCSVTGVRCLSHQDLPNSQDTTTNVPHSSYVLPSVNITNKPMETIIQTLGSLIGILAAALVAVIVGWILSYVYLRKKINQIIQDDSNHREITLQRSNSVTESHPPVGEEAMFYNTIGKALTCDNALNSECDDLTENQAYKVVGCVTNPSYAMASRGEYSVDDQGYELV